MFALKSQDNISMFENTDDYMHYLCADHFEKMNDWVMSIRGAKVISYKCILINLDIIF